MLDFYFSVGLGLWLGLVCRVGLNPRHQDLVFDKTIQELIKGNLSHEIACIAVLSAMPKQAMSVPVR
jgi:hypothetical protein